MVKVQIKTKTAAAPAEGGACVDGDDELLSREERSFEKLEAMSGRWLCCGCAIRVAVSGSVDLVDLPTCLDNYELVTIC
jgi:hypothetical protein